MQLADDDDDDDDDCSFDLTGQCLARDLVSHSDLDRVNYSVITSAR